MKNSCFCGRIAAGKLCRSRRAAAGRGAFMRRSCTGLRLCAGSAAAAVSTLVLLAPPWPAPLAVLYKIASCCGVVAVCYGVSGARSFARLCGWYAGAERPAVRRGGAARGTGQQPERAFYRCARGSFLLCCAGVYGLLRGLLAVFGRPQRGCFAAVLQIAGATVPVQAYHDTGFTLQDPPCRAAGGAGAVPAVAQPAARTAARLLRQLVCLRHCPASGAEGAVCTLRRRYRPLPAARRARRAVPWAAPRARPAGGLFAPRTPPPAHGRCCWGTTWRRRWGV